MPPHLPPSLLTHLDTDVQILERLVQRSKDQHESAIFYQSAKHVLRVGKKVVLALEAARIDVPEGSKEVARRDKYLKQLVKIFATTLLNSSRKNTQQVKILYFLPLTTLLQAIFGRLFTLTLSLGPAVGVDVETLCGMLKISTQHEREVSEQSPALNNATAEDFGQKIERSAIPCRVDQVKGSPSTSRLASTSIDDGVAGSKFRNQETARSTEKDVKKRAVLDGLDERSLPIKRPSPTLSLPSLPRAKMAKVEQATNLKPPTKEMQAEHVQKPKIAQVSESLDAVFGFGEEKRLKTKNKVKGVVLGGERDIPAKKKKKPKKVDDMDSIFG